MFTLYNDSNYAQAFTSAEKGLCLFFKKLCPHCKNMEKVLEKVSVQAPELSILLIDMEESPTAAAAVAAERAPTLVVLKQGQIAAKQAGLMNPRELLSFISQA